MIHMIRERSFWAALVGAVIGYAAMHGMMAQPSATGQASAVQAATEGVMARVPYGTTQAPSMADTGGTAQAPRLIPFQAYLTDMAGRPVEGAHMLTFYIYDDPTQGSPLWSETHTAVPVAKGLVNVLLGSQPSSAPLPRFDAPRYVGAKVDGGLELVPRQQIIPAIYAADADRATEAEHSAESTHAADADRAKQLVNPATLDPAVTVDSNGLVGIGTTVPEERLHVNGNVKAQHVIATGNVGAQYDMNAGGNVTAAANFIFGGSGGLLYRYEPDTYYVKVIPDTLEIKGNVVGINTVAGRLVTFNNNGVTLFFGPVYIPDLHTGGGDVAESFAIDSAEPVEPGMVVVIDPSQPGRLKLAAQPYDRGVAGIISGANGLKPGMVMETSGWKHASGDWPVALTGRVYCWCDASAGPIRPGDLLTTSSTVGHAMKVTDHAQAVGAILGKAMSNLESGTGLVLVLVSLQ